jgi:hypothetical protein
MKPLSKELTSKWSLKEPLYVEKKDERYARLSKQLATNGFCDAETWDLSSVIAEFILPRLIRFKELNNGFPGGFTSEEWDAILDQIIFAFDWSLHDLDEKYNKLTIEEREINWKKYEKGMEQFSKWFRQLWW